MKKTNLLSGVFATFACGIMMTSCVYDMKTTRTETYEDENGDSVVITTTTHSRTRKVRDYACRVTIDGVKHPELKSEKEVESFLKDNNITNYTTKTNTDSISYGNGDESVEIVIEVTTK